MMKKFSFNIFIILSIFILIFIYILFFTDNSYLKRNQLEQKITILNEDISSLKKEIKGLEQDVIDLKNNDLYIEKYARDKLKLLKPDEEIVKIDTSDYLDTLTKENKNQDNKK